MSCHQCLIDALECRTLLSGTITVTNTNDSGAGSLRQAITNANAFDGITEINFNIPGSGVQFIGLSSALPALTQDIDLQGPVDSSGNPLVAIEGEGNAGITVNRDTPSDSDASVISNLEFDEFTTALTLKGDAPTEVYGCRIGTDVTGTSARDNSGDGIDVFSANSQIGTTHAGNKFVNVISDNAGDGIKILSSAIGTIVENCFIGTNITGTGALPNKDWGIDCAAGAFLGGIDANEANLISGNSVGGIMIDSSADGVNVQGSKIGTNAAGTAALGRQVTGLLIMGSQTLVGRDSVPVGNLISGNVGDGVDIFGGTDSDIQGNTIGANGALTAAIGNNAGVAIQNAASNFVEDNVISGNEADGIAVVQTTGDAHGNILGGNIIGANDSADDISIPNGLDGILIAGASMTKLEENFIYNNALAGIHILGNATADAMQIFGNPPSEGAIYNNKMLGIVLGNNADAPLPVSPSGGSVAGDPNNDLNYPVLSSAVIHGGTLTVSGTLTAPASTTYDVEFFASPAADPTGFGQGRDFLDTANVTTDSSGSATFSADLDLPPSGDTVVTAVAISQTTGDMSEFSNAQTLTSRTISGVVYDDLNGNGRQDPGEPGLAGRHVYLDVLDEHQFPVTIQGEDVLQFTAKTDAEGRFKIKAPPFGIFDLRIENVTGFTAVNPGPKGDFIRLDITATSKLSDMDFGQRKFTPKVAPTLAIAATGPYIDNTGQTFAEDTGFTGGADADVPLDNVSIANTDDDVLYLNNHFGPKFSYRFAVPNGTYTLKLLFADTSSDRVGQRVFDVTSQGKTLLNHFDIFSQVGANAALNESFTVKVTNKQFSLAFKRVVGEALISAFELTRA